jgi:hypothetical protein
MPLPHEVQILPDKFLLFVAIEGLRGFMYKGPSFPPVITGLPIKFKGTWPLGGMYGPGMGTVEFMAFGFE